MPSAVKMTGIVKRFPLVLANDHVDFDLAWGEVHALIGENGAGKSTLMKILYGLQPPDEGSIEIDGKPVVMTGAREAIDLGIGMVHQHFMLVEPLTVTENLVLGSEPTAGVSLDYRSARARTAELIERFEFDIDPDTRIEELPVGFQQQVEILKTLYRDAKILIMDEPTAVLTPQETRGLFRFLQDFADDGHAVIFISHKLDEVMEICDRMSVMRDGQMIGTVTREETDQRKLANMMVGREVLLRVEKGDPDPREVRLEATDLRLMHPIKQKPILDGVGFSLRAGEILGIAGDRGERPVGARRVPHRSDAPRQRHRADDGARHHPRERPQAARGGAQPRPRGPQRARPRRRVLRRDEQHPRRLPPPPYSGPLGFLDEPTIEGHARELVEAYDVRPRATSVNAHSYSGGNAQKLIVARELEREPSVLIMAQPTRGVDIGAIEFIHQQIVRARDLGLAVLLVSADLNEVMSLSDRIVVMYEGKIMGEMTQAEATAEKLGLLMAGSEIS